MSQDEGGLPSSEQYMVPVHKEGWIGSWDSLDSKTDRGIGRWLLCSAPLGTFDSLKGRTYHCEMVISQEVSLQLHSSFIGLTLTTSTTLKLDQWACYLLPKVTNGSSSNLPVHYSGLS